METATVSAGGGGGTGKSMAAEFNQSLHYGDLIMLHIENLGAFVQSTGFSNSNLYAQKNNFNTQLFCRNQRDFVFQIQPRMIFDARKDYRQTLRFFNENFMPKNNEGEEGGEGGEEENEENKDKVPIEGGPNPDPPMSAADMQKRLDKQKDEIDAYKKKLALLKKKMQDEEESNKKLVERRKGENVTYGSEIQLYHVDSGSYICAKKTSADLERTCNKVELVERPSKGIYFRIMPRYKYRQEGEKIKYGDQIIFLNTKISLYLHVCDTQIPIEDPIPLPLVPGTTKNEITPIIIDRRCPPINYVPLYELNAGTGFSRFKAIPYCTYDEDDNKFLKGGSIVTLKHSELGGLLSSDDNDFTDDGLAEVFLWVFKGKEDDYENFNTQSLFEVEIAIPENMGMIARTSDDESFSHKYRLRHLNTGRLVTVQEIDFNGERVVTLGLAEHIKLKPNPNPVRAGDTYRVADSDEFLQSLEDNTLFSFVPTNVDDDSRIKNLSCVKLQHCKSQLYISMKANAIFRVEEPEQDHNDPDDNSEIQGKIYEKMADEDINNANRHVIDLKEQAGYEDAFFIQILDPQTLKDILFVSTLVGALKKNIPYLCNGQPTIPKDRFVEMDLVMKMLMDFAKCEEKSANDMGDGDNGPQLDMNELEEKIIKRQKTLRELYLVEYIVQILYFPFATKTYTLSQITQEDYITLLCQDAYQLLDTAVGGYEINERYASQWINFFFSQAMRTNKQNDISAQATVEELLSDNTQLLETRITPQIIKQFIYLCKSQEKDKKLIMLLTALCTCYGKAIEHNQMFIVKFLLEDRDTQSKLMMPIRIRQGQLEVKLQGNSYITLHMLEEFSKGRDEGRIYKYFKAIVDLSANLNIGRNLYAYQHLNNLYAFDPVFSIIYDQNLPFDLRSCFLKLMNSMHLDRDPLEPLDIPTTTMIMNDLRPFDEFVTGPEELTYHIKKSTIEIPSKLMKLKDFILEFLMGENGVQDINNKKKNRFVQYMISTLQFMLQHGFYQDQSEINKLSMPLITLLDGSDDIFVEEGAKTDDIDLSSIRYKYTQNSEIMLVSKKIQCECLIFISQLELDARAELFLSKLKRQIESSLGDTMAPAGEGIEDTKMALPDKVALRVTQNHIPQLKQDQIMSLDQIKGQSAGVLEAIGKGVEPRIPDNKEVSNFVKMPNQEFLDLVSQMKGFEAGTGEIYICILFDLLLYQYNELNQVAFDLLIRYFNRKSTLLEALSNIQILESQKSIEILTKVKIYSSQLKDLQQEAEIFMTNSEGDSQEKKATIAEIFMFLTRFLIIPATKTPKARSDVPKKRSSGFPNEEPEKLDDLINKLKDDDYVKENLKPEDELSQFENEEYGMFNLSQHNENKENQRLMMNFNMHELAIYFIKYRTEEVVGQTTEHQAMIKQCYRFLIKFVKNNVQNQQKLREHLEVFLKDIEKHALAIQLVYEIFKDNKKFLNLNVSKILRKIATASEKLHLTDSKKGQLYQLLTAFCRCKDKLVRANQQDIVVYLTSQGALSNIFYLFVGEGVKDIFKILQTQKQIQIPGDEKDLIELGAAELLKGAISKPKPLKGQIFDPTQSNPTIVMGNQVINVIALIELLSLCCEGKSDKAEEQCQTELLTLENSFKIIKNCEYFWPLKRTMVNYVWQCFLDSNSKTIFADPNLGNLDFIWEMADLLIQDMKNILVSIPQTMESEVYVKYPYKAPVTLRSESVQFLIDSILPFFKYLIKRKDVYIEEEKEHIVADFTACTVDFYYLTQDQDAKRKAYNILGYVYTRHNLSKYLENLKHPLIGLHPGNVKQLEPGSADQNQDQQLSRQETFNYDHSDSSKLNKIIHQITNNQEVKEMVEKEFEELVSWFVNIEDRVKDVVSGNSNYDLESFSQLTFPNIVKALLEMLDKRELPKPLHSVGLQIVRKLIEAENMNCITPAADWETDDYIDFQGQIVEKQNQLVEIGVVQFLCKHISDLDDDELLEQCVLLGIALLLGGNNNAQQAFLAYFQENDTYNRTLSKLKLTMIKEFDKAKIYLTEKNAKLTMIAKTQERMALHLFKKLMKTAKLDDNKNAKTTGKKTVEDQKVPEEIPFAPEFEEEEELPEAFDNTLENLMTIEQSVAGDVSMMTDINAQGPAEEGANGKPQKEEAEPKTNNQNQKSLQRVIRILRFLQLMAEGHYRPLQDHLREQKMIDGQANPRTFDFIAFMSTMLGVYQKQFINCYSHELGSQMLDTLVEVIQGPCKDNQRSLVSSKAIDNCRDLLNIRTDEKRELKMKGFTDDNVELIDGLKQNAVKLLLSIIEGPIDEEIMKAIKKTLDDFVVVFERLKTVYDKFVSEVLNLDPETATLSEIQGSLQKDSFDDDAIMEGFDLFSLLRTLAETVPSIAKISEKYAEEPFYLFFQENTGFIEIYHDESQQILRQYFPIKPVCRYLSKQTRSILMREVDRSSPQQKIMDLLKAVPDIVDEMDHIEILSRATIKVTPALTDNIRLINLLNALVICILITGWYEYGVGQDSDGSQIIEPVCSPAIGLAITILGGIEIFLCVLLIIGEMITRGSLIIKSQWREYVDEKKALYINLVNAKKEAPGYSEFNIIKATELSLLDARLVLLTSGPDAEEFQVDDSGKKNFGHLILRIEYMWTCLSFILKDGRFFFLLTMLSFSVLGMFNSPAFFSFLLLDIVNRFPSLSNVIRAVTTNANQLIMAALLELILLWIYTVLLFTFFFDHYFNDDIKFNENEAGDNICRNLFHCYVSTLNFGLRNGGGIGDAMPSNSYFNESKEVYFLRAISDLSFFMIIILLFFNIIFGIIIDTFAGLRDEAAVMEDDMKNICYICGSDRQTFDKDSANGFTYHIKKEHNLWQYVFFIIHLNAKDTTDYTGIETYVADKLVQDDISWFPFNKAISLEADAYQISEDNNNQG